VLIHGNERCCGQPFGSWQVPHVIDQIANGRPARKLERHPAATERLGVRCEKKDSYSHRA
jgi:hypothetical protein